jgi:hypothetical protein
MDAAPLREDSIPKDAKVSRRRLDVATPADGIPRAMCARCGLTGVHADARDCIDALRDLVAVLQFKTKAKAKRR